MAISGPTSLGALAVTGNVVYPASVRGSWTTIISDLEATAETAAVLLRPKSAVSSYIIPARLPGLGTRVQIRARYTAGATITTSPVVRLFTIDGDINGSGAFTDDETQQFQRIDNADGNAAGVTVTCSSGADIRDTTYAYSDILPDLTGYDCLGGAWLIALIETAGNISTGTPILQARVLN